MEVEEEKIDVHLLSPPLEKRRRDSDLDSGYWTSSGEEDDELPPEDIAHLVDLLQGNTLHVPTHERHTITVEMMRAFDAAQARSVAQVAQRAASYAYTHANLLSHDIDPLQWDPTMHLAQRNIQVTHPLMLCWNQIQFLYTQLSSELVFTPVFWHDAVQCTMRIIDMLQECIINADLHPSIPLKVHQCHLKCVRRLFHAALARLNRLDPDGSAVAPALAARVIPTTETVEIGRAHV